NPKAARGGHSCCLKNLLQPLRSSPLEMSRLTQLFGHLHRGKYRAQLSKRPYIPKRTDNSVRCASRPRGQNCSALDGDGPEGDLPRMRKWVNWVLAGHP